MVAAFVYSSAGPVPLPDQPGDDLRPRGVGLTPPAGRGWWSGG